MGEDSFIIEVRISPVCTIYNNKRVSTNCNLINVVRDTVKQTLKFWRKETPGIDVTKIRGVVNEFTTTGIESCCSWEGKSGHIEVVVKSGKEMV